MAPSPTSSLDSDSIVTIMSKSLPPPDNSSPTLLKDPYAAIALFAHACMRAVGFRLIGLGEDHRLETTSESGDITPLPSEWAASSSYAFRYAHSQSSMEYLIKVNRLGNKALIFGVGLGDDKTASFEVKADDFISENSLRHSSADADVATKLRHVFISPGRVGDLVSLFKLNIVQKLAPGLRKAGYEDNFSTTEQPRRQEQPRPPDDDPLREDQPPPARPYPFDDPLVAPPRRPIPAGDFPPPGFDDEYEINRPPRGIPLGGRPPFGNIGEQDLYPPGLGPHDPLRIGPGGGGYRGGVGGGMHPTFDDPIFGGQGGPAPFDPRAPPGARYDPVGPGDRPPNLRGGGRFPGGQGGFGGGNPFGGFGSGDFI